VRWLGRNVEAKQRIDRAFQLLHDAQRYPAEKIEPMSDVYDTQRALADDYAESGQVAKGVETYQQLLDKLMAWKPDSQNNLRDASCISRTWTALAVLLRRAGRPDQAIQLETQRTQLWNHWNSELPNSQFLLRQSLVEIAPPAALRSAVKH
jgi:tetratricopeptide (TPR) repeat protein